MGNPTPSFGPGFQDARSWLYRAEYAAITLVILGYLVWRSIHFGGIDWLEVLFWIIFPDLAAFVPIGASSQSKEWPPWGANLYNFFHTILIWAAAFALAWLALGSAYLPLLGWLGHITADRAVGYGLRQNPRGQPSR